MGDSLTRFVNLSLEYTTALERAARFVEACMDPDASSGHAQYLAHQLRIWQEDPGLTMPDFDQIVADLQAKRKESPAWR